MSRATVEFYFDFTCPYAYIASSSIAAVAREARARLVWRPMLLGGVFRGISEGGSPMARFSPAKQRHNHVDAQRFAALAKLPLRMPAGHPIRSVRALRALLSLPEPSWPRIVHEIYRGYWEHGEDIATPAGVLAALERAGVAGDDIQAALQANDDPAIKAELRRRTDEAVSRDVFGAPTIFVRVPDEPEPLMFWGQDRLHLVRAVLAGWRPSRAAPTALERAAARAKTARFHGRPRLHFFYDFSSPFAYLAATQIERIAELTGARLSFRPMLLGAVFRDIGAPNVPLHDMPEQKRAYYRTDLHHWASYWGVPFGFASRFPQRTITALRLALAAGDRIAELSHALFRVPWVEDGDLDERHTLVRVLSAHGFDADAMLERASAPEVKQKLRDNTAEAVARGVFGAPTCIVELDPDDRARDVLLWGQDRLQLLGHDFSGVGG